MKLLTDVLEIAIHRLIQAGCETPRLDAELLLAYALGKDRTWLYLYPQTDLNENQLNNFYNLLSRRERREPVAYIIGHKEFFGLEFQVNRHVLIPRPETELLVETALEIVKREWPTYRSSVVHGESSPAGVPGANFKAEFTVADVGTGSGCIAITLAKNLPQASFLALDLSTAALQLARQNAIRHEVAERITFMAGNLLQPLTGPINLIVSNPPYVSRLELLTTSVSPEVGRYEPRLALDGGQDGLEVIRQLLPQAKEKLKPGGSLLVEIGATQGQAVNLLARTYFPEAQIEIKKDLAGLDRLLMVCTHP